jgi:hypothetical protein
VSKYRPVSLLTSFSDIFETVMQSRILKYLTKYDILSTEQYGFRFDCVNHYILLSKLKFYGISDKDLTLYRSYLDNRYCKTAIYNDNENSNKVSHWAKVRHGVPKGSVLGPLLFLLYANDLPKIINKTSTIIFADDTSILFTHTNLIDFNKNIHIVFTALNKWLRAYQLSLILIKQIMYTLQLREMYELS